MAVTIKGFQGTVSDADMATQLPSLPGVVYSATDLAVSTVSGARSVAITDGSAFAHFVRAIFTSLPNLVLAPPTSGGKWYVVAIKREWSPTSTAVIEAVDVGLTTDGTVPTVPPTLAGLPAGLRNNPGTAGSTSAFGHHQPLAWAHVRAADTTLTLFDLRLIASTAGQAIPASISALLLATQFRAPQQGALVSCADGFTYRRSGTVWKLMPLPDMFCDAYWSATQTDPNLPDSTWANVPHDAAFFDKYGMRQAGTNTFKLPWSGHYRMQGRVQPLFANPNRSILRWFNVSAGNDVAWGAISPIVGGNDPKDFTADWYFNAGDVIRLDMWQNSGQTQYLSRFQNAYTANRMVVTFLGEQ